MTLNKASIKDFLFRKHDKCGWGIDRFRHF